jgi:fumarate reductase subunit C
MYVEYQRFKKEWWAYRRTYHRYMLDELVNRALKEKSLTGNTQAMVNNIKDLQEVWDTLDVCYDWPKSILQKP